MSWPWSELGLDGPASLEEVRRAYAQRVKEVHPEEDPEGFQRLHTAYQQARQAARRARRAEPSAEGDVRAEPPVKREVRLEQPHPRPVPPEQPRPPEPQQDQEERLDFTELLRQGQAEEKAPESQPQEPELDFDTLLSQEEGQEKAEEAPQTQARAPSWDFQRIFQEENHRRTEKQSGSRQDGAVSLALELVERLLEEERPHQDWERFLMSVAFFRVKWDPRFMAALAGAFQAEPMLDPRIRETVCTAYGFQSGRVPREHRAFYEAIRGQKEASQKQGARRFRRRHPFLFLMSLIVGGVLLLWLVVSLGVYLYERPDRQMTAMLCQYIQEDYSYPVESQYGGYLTSAKLFYLPVQQMSFTAWPEGERDLSRGQLGYETDLGNRLLTMALEEFAETWKSECDLTMTDAEGSYVDRGEMPAVYEISTSLTGGTECLIALVEEMDRLSFTYQPSDGPFPGEEILSYYQKEVPVEIVARLVEECGLGEMEFGDRAYRMENLGTITLHDDDYVLVGGVEEATGQTVRLYLYNNMYLISIPAADFDPNMSFIDYARLLMGDKISKPGNDLPWPGIGIVGVDEAAKENG